MGSDGLKGYEKLGNNEQIHLFYTENAKNISLDIICNPGEAELKIYKVPAKKQSLDMHLVSYLGYLVGSNQENDCEYVIVSKDKDYDDVIQFWQKQSGIAISRVGQIEERMQKKVQQSSEAGKSRKPKEAPNADKQKVNNEIQQVLSKAKMPSEIIGYVASVVVKNKGTENSRQNVYRILISRYGQDRGLDLYKRIKKYL